MARDVLLIVLGAVLAVTGEGWREARATRQRTTSAMVSMRTEISTNLARLQRARARHDSVAAMLLGYQNRGAVPTDSVLFTGLFNPATVVSTAWQTARDTRALGDLPYAVVLRLGTLYGHQDRYTEVSQALEQAVIVRLQTEGLQAHLRRWMNLIVLNQEFGNKAGELGARYVSTLAFLDSVGGAGGERTVPLPRAPR